MIKDGRIIVFLLIGIFSIGFIYTLLYQNVYAHNFISNDTATFLTQVYQTEIELMLAINNFPSNMTLVMDHAEDATSIMNDIYDSEGDIEDDTDFITRYNEAISNPNSTVYAMVLANIADEILRKYGEAYDVDYDLTNMSNMMIMISGIDSSSSVNLHRLQHSNTEKNNSSSIINFAEYQSAIQLSERAYQIFKNKLQPLSMSNSVNNDTTVTTKLEKSLVDIKDLMMNNKETASELMKIVHGQLHPILQAAYNLQLKK
ncbi:MAG: hypothetical protein M3297_16440 [Thermoproteota archaeon]|nr:hypothetical protein [Thermoproteota archaeon]